MPQGVGPVGSSIPARYFIVQRGAKGAGPGQRNEAAEERHEPPPAAPAVEESASREPGVLRNLGEDHYHATAAVRLTLNFSEQVAARRAQATEEAAEQYVADVRDALDRFAASADLNPEQQALLDDARDSFLAALATPAAGSGNAEALAASARAALDEFAVSLQALEEGEPAPTVDPADLVGELSAALDAAFTDRAGTAAAFPEPDGNGVAFSKFVGIYEELRALAEQSKAGPGVDGEQTSTFDAFA